MSQPNWGSIGHGSWDPNLAGSARCKPIDKIGKIFGIIVERRGKGKVSAKGVIARF